MFCSSTSPRSEYCTHHISLHINNLAPISNNGCLVPWNHTLRSLALAWVLPRSQRLRNDTRAGQIPKVPLRSTLRFPRPEDPARMALIGIQLCLDVIFHIDLIDVQHVIDSTLILLLAVAIIAFTFFECAVVACTTAEPVQPFRAVGLCACPLSYNGPFVGAT